MAYPKEGDKVSWNWGDGTASGEVVKRYEQRITLSIKGTAVTRDASSDCPAYKIEQSDGDIVLKSASEIESA